MIVSKGANSYGFNQDVVDPEVLNEVSIENEGFLIYFSFLSLPSF